MLEAILELDTLHELIVFIIAALPVFELRGAIPAGINVLNMPWYYVYLIAVLGNLFPIPFILLFLKQIVRLLSHIEIFRRFFEWLFAKSRKRGSQIEKYERIGLTIFVAIPLPITGAWTGAIAAVLMGMPFRRSFLLITIGVLIAGVIVTCLSLLGWTGAIIAGAMLIALALIGILKSNKQ